MSVVTTHLLTRRIVKEEEKSYLEIPFPVQDDAERIEVAYVYDRSDGRTVVDIGIRSPERIVGWSGGARESFFVGLGKATPGCLAGPLPEGDWHILLGAYRIPESGCEVRIEIAITHKHPRWIKGDLHMHGVHSDGSYTVADAIRSCKEKGLAFAAFTDHNNASQNLSTLAADDGLVLIPGVELTSYKGHANLLGAMDALDDFRVLTPEQASDALRRAADKGSLVSLNHPFCNDCPWELGFDVPFDAIEVWNGPWRPLNEAAVQWWQEQLSAGRKIVAIGGSDTHAPHLLVIHGTPTAYVKAGAESGDEIMQAIRGGRVVLSFAPNETFIDLSLEGIGVGETANVRDRDEWELTVSVSGAKGDRVQLWSDRGIEREWDVEEQGEFTMRVPAGRLFYRAEAKRFLPEWDRTITACLTNPIYLEA
ncbi:CehA/McbA family metallohydrolase [Cohnella zeiphila]|uniref:PHP domain-containing protein n=1 Tax=Cohnella zeiphila TaxID=2761120 RepID=A0A7X0SKK3_9BACL|nr:CehA/McbA family metallohydrolase [Cohnella zeiphila]MBB6731720.1 PHP domain-containing protein [Cohnella zeiphila]